jgi:hypothetical protein
MISKFHDQQKAKSNQAAEFVGPELSAPGSSGLLL